MQARLLAVALIEALQHGSGWRRWRGPRRGRAVGDEDGLQRALRLLVGPTGQDHSRVLIVRVFLEGA